MKRPAIILSLIACIAAAVGCGGNGDSASQDDPPVPVAPAHDGDPMGSTVDTGDASSRGATQAGDGRLPKTGPFRREFQGVAFDVPAGWREVEPQATQIGFIEARFLVTAGDDELELTFSRNTAGFDMNAGRWSQQFTSPPDEPPRVETLSIDGRDVRWIDIVGTTAGIEGQSRMVGVEFPLPPGALYLKLKGTRDAFAHVDEQLRQFAQSADFVE